LLSNFNLRRPYTLLLYNKAQKLAEEVAASPAPAAATSALMAAGGTACLHLSFQPEPFFH